MEEHLAFVKLLDEPASRRGWLLYKALENLPLNQAIDLARAADEFITGTRWECCVTDAPARSEPAVALQSPGEERNVKTPTAAAGTASRGIAPVFPAELRHRLIDRLATGAQNAEAAAEFDLTPKQVQGVRMGSAREINKRREHLRVQEPPAQDTPSLSASVDDVVRYLRQQDDVVVPQGRGEFLVNARFRLPLAELVSRANRMRVRQGKPEFHLGGGQPARAETVRSANGHPLFWSEKPPGQSSAGPVSSI